MQVYNISRYNSLKHYLQKNNIDYDIFLQTTRIKYFKLVKKIIMVKL